MAHLNKVSEHSFDALYREYFKDIYRFIYRLTGNDEDARDITQEAFARLYRFLESGKKRPLEEPRAWIFKVACNICYTSMKREKRFQEIVAENPGALAGEAPGCLEEDWLQQERLNQVREAFNRLSLRDRMALELFQAGLGYREIAGALGLNRASVGKVLFRARRRLAKEINQGERS